MPKRTHSTDVAIIGAGPVGLFAVFELGMLKIRCHVIDALDARAANARRSIPRSRSTTSPAIPRSMAGELVERWSDQAAPFEPVYHLGQRVERIDAAGRRLAARDRGGHAGSPGAW